MDRNIVTGKDETQSGRSLSARRAWIEMHIILSMKPAEPVALRKESVDRNSIAYTVPSLPTGRSPQGERG